MHALSLTRTRKTPMLPFPRHRRFPVWHRPAS